MPKGLGNYVLTPEVVDEIVRKEKIEASTQLKQRIQKQIKTYPEIKFTNETETVSKIAQKTLNRLTKYIKHIKNKHARLIQIQLPSVIQELENLSEWCKVIGILPVTKKLDSLHIELLDLLYDLKNGNISNVRELHSILKALETTVKEVDLDPDTLDYVNRSKPDVLRMRSIAVKRFEKLALKVKAPLVFVTKKKLNKKEIQDLKSVFKFQITKIGYYYIPEADLFVVNTKKIFNNKIDKANTKEFDIKQQTDLILHEINKTADDKFFAYHTISLKQNGFYIVWLLKTSDMQIASQLGNAIKDFQIMLKLP